MSDHPLLRGEITCPICEGSKSIGTLWCWPCHNWIQRGSDQDRERAENTIDASENRLEALNEAIWALQHGRAA